MRATVSSEVLIKSSMGSFRGAAIGWLSLVSSWAVAEIFEPLDPCVTCLATSTDVSGLLPPCVRLELQRHVCVIATPHDPRRLFDGAYQTVYGMLSGARHDASSGMAWLARWSGWRVILHTAARVSQDRNFYTHIRSDTDTLMSRIRGLRRKCPPSLLASARPFPYFLQPLQSFITSDAAKAEVRAFLRPFAGFQVQVHVCLVRAPHDARRLFQSGNQPV
jgi:hypothetical protein